jgi:hypothetical protein
MLFKEDFVITVTIFEILFKIQKDALNFGKYKQIRTLEL